MNSDWSQMVSCYSLYSIGHMAGLHKLFLMFGHLIRDLYVCGGRVNVCIDDMVTIQTQIHAKTQVISTNTKAIASEVP
jgi:hypothetical protein